MGILMKFLKPNLKKNRWNLENNENITKYPENFEEIL